MKARRSATASAAYEPSLTLTPLRACSCGAPHPLATKPRPTDVKHCPGCGADVAPPGPEVVVPAIIVGWRPWAVAARAAFAIGRWLNNLAKGL